MHKADQPDLVGDLADADGLSGEHGTEVDFTMSDTDSAALRDLNGSIVKRVLRYVWIMVFTC